jgi:hypothetical protein
MYRLIRVCSVLLLIFALVMTSVAFAQTTTTPKTDGPVDQSNIIFPGCRLSNLTTSSSTNVTEDKKSSYIKGCIQDVIRFVIVMACLGAILKIAASGIAQLDPTNSTKGDNPTKVISNLVIGLFLLLVGWNLVGILNSSFNNVNFLKLPTNDVCKIANACETPQNKLAREAKEALTTYETMKKDKRYAGSKDQQRQLVSTLQDYCSKLSAPLYKEAFAAKSLDQKACAEKYSDTINQIADIGSVSPDIEGVKQFKIKKDKVIALAKSGKTFSQALEDYNELTAQCSETPFAKSLTPEGKAVFEDCKKIEAVEPKNARETYYNNLKK